MTTFAKTRALATTANRAAKGLKPKYRGRDHRNLFWAASQFLKWDALEMGGGARWDHRNPRIRQLVGGVVLYTWVQSHLKGVPQPLLVAQLLQG